MKKLFLFTTMLALFNLMFLDQSFAQVCCAAKASASKASSCLVQTNQDDSKSATAGTTLTAGPEVATATTTMAGTPRLLVSASFLANPLTATLALLAKCNGAVNDPCCEIPGCDPSNCEPKKCDVSKCKGIKN